MHVKTIKHELKRKMTNIGPFVPQEWFYIFQSVAICMMWHCLEYCIRVPGSKSTTLICVVLFTLLHPRSPHAHIDASGSWWNEHFLKLWYKFCSSNAAAWKMCYLVLLQSLQHLQGTRNQFTQVPDWGQWFMIAVGVFLWGQKEQIGSKQRSIFCSCHFILISVKNMRQERG